MIQLDLIRGPLGGALLFLGFVVYLFRRIRRTKKAPSQSTSSPILNEDVAASKGSYYHIEPLSDFNLESTEPIKIRPFKPKYHLTMALENTTMSDLVAMDNTYTTRIKLRSQLIREQPQDVLAVNPKAAPAVMEFYDWIVGTYLPNRFPTLFALTHSGVLNHVTGQTLPLHASSAEDALRIIGENVDDDFLWLLPSSDPADEGKYRLEAFITCFPSGFNTPQKLNLLLKDIHGPVPGYSDKLEKSMDRFFSSLPAGKIVKRVNWSITTHRRLFTFDGNHLTDEELASQLQSNPDDEVDIDNTVLRCERQTLHRLPETKALVFAFKTYQYGMQELRDEGSGEELARAVDGLGTGNVPGMTVYKRQVVWGEKVKAYLRAEK